MTDTTKPITMTPEQEAEIRGLDWMPAMVRLLLDELDATRARVEAAEASARELEARAALDGLGGKIEVGVMDNEITDKGGTVDMMQDGPLVAGWEVWFVEGGGERWWLLVKPGEDVRAAMRASGNWDDEAHITEDAAGARRWTFHESLTMTVRVEDHPTIRMTLAEAAETQACDAARHDHCRVIATTCW